MSAIKVLDVNFPDLSSDIPASPAYGEYIYRSLFVMQGFARHKISFPFEAITDKEVDVNKFLCSI
jgi:hypothetical protein